MSGFMKTVLKNWNRALSERFYKNEKENQSSFPFLYPFIFFSLPSFLSDFMSVYMAWRKPKSSVNSGFGVEFFSTIFINPDIYLTGFVKRCLQKSWKQANSAAVTKYKKQPSSPLATVLWSHSCQSPILCTLWVHSNWWSKGLDY